MTLYEILKQRFKTNTAIGKHFPRRGKARSSQAVGKWARRGVPEDVAILCHLDAEIPYRHPILTNSNNEE
ncbi:hypothetical protein ACE2PP_005243 [Salmonella enterica]|nr:hypothetical protein [Salmonella enterica subsp. enterica serovar Santiago]EDQ9399407.1 hypothetical protein [Salmonella enterica]EBH8967278.1 hypothetical protein [Salmonella enterica subsp. enterica serovar Santiago]EDR4377404.1 hypothetical protein [Salmonella enterica]EEG5734283.1 hypothetical protein [Salmonella enterica]